MVGEGVSALHPARAHRMCRPLALREAVTVADYLE